MGENTKIEWADHTFNPWVGCTKVSPACDHCYAEGWAKRAGRDVWGSGKPRQRTSVANWRQPIKWNAEAARTGTRPRVFCASLADVFDNEVPAQWRADLLQLIRDTPHLDWLLLTKRIGNAARMLDEAAELMDSGMGVWAPSVFPHVWIGATVVNQEEAERDIPKLLRVPAAKRFLSLEPLLSSVIVFSLDGPLDVPEGFKSPIDWVIVGGESGPGARPMLPDWVRSFREQCASADVPFFFKRWGDWLHSSQGAYGGPASAWQWEDGEPFTGKEGDRGGMGLFKRSGKALAGRLLDGRTWDEVPA